MTPAEIISTLQAKLAVATGRHLYGILGDYAQLNAIAADLVKGRLPEGGRFPVPLNVNRGILDAIPDHAHLLVKEAARRDSPEHPSLHPTRRCHRPEYLWRALSHLAC